MNLEPVVGVVYVKENVLHLENVKIQDHGEKKPFWDMGWSSVKLAQGYGTEMWMHPWIFTRLQRMRYKELKDQSIFNEPEAPSVLLRR